MTIDPPAIVAAKLRGVSGAGWAGDWVAVGGYLVGPRGVYAPAAEPAAEAVRRVFRWDEYVRHVSPPAKGGSSLSVLLAEDREVVLDGLTMHQVFGLAQALGRIERLRVINGG